MSINRVIISGNLTRDPELKALPSGTSVLDMRMAVNDRRKNAQTGDWEDVANYVDVVVFGQRGESLSRFLQKGTKVAVAGRLRYREWENQQGEKRNKLEVVADDVDFMSGRGESGRTYEAPAVDMPASEPIADEEIPF